MLAMDSAPTSPAAPVPARRRALWAAALLLGLASVGASLAMRIVHRDSWVPGWDYLLTVQGQYLLTTRGLAGALYMKWLVGLGRLSGGTEVLVPNGVESPL
jgi:hypothetical protein